MARPHHSPGCEQYERGNHLYSVVLGLHGAQEGGGPPCGGTCLVCFILHLFDIHKYVCHAGVLGYAAAAAVVGATGWSRRRLVTNPGGGPWQAYTHFLMSGLQRQPTALAA